MTLHGSLTRGILAVCSCLALAACETGGAAGPGAVASLTVHGSAAALAPLVAPRLGAGLSDPVILTGDAAGLRIRMYALWVSHNADCSAATLVQDYTATGQDKDFMLSPVLFTGNPGQGTYPCIVVRMSDVLRVEPATTFGACVAGTEYRSDIYRDGETDWKDVDLNPIVGRGTDGAPVDDHVTIFMTRDTSAVIARGVSTHQVVPLESDLIVPGHSTFHLDARGAVQTDGVDCGLEPPRMSFE